MKTCHLAVFGVIAVVCSISVLTLNSCSLLFPKNEYQVLGQALAAAAAKGLAAQNDEANASARAAKTLDGYTELASGLSYIISAPVCEYTSVYKWDTATGKWDTTYNYSTPPEKGDSNGPGLWQITMHITCQVSTNFDRYASDGYTFSGDIVQNFDAIYVWELDIQGEEGGVATSTQISANTDMTLLGSVVLSGAASGTFSLNSMTFHIKVDERGRRECYFVENSGSATLGSKDVTEQLIDPIEAGVENSRI